MDWNKTAFIVGLCVMTFALVPPINRLSRAVEELIAERECILPGTIPERPEGSGWKLTWINTRKERR